MNLLTMIANATGRRLEQMFPGYYKGAKHNHYEDFSFPVDLTFKLLWDMYNRNGFAHAGVGKTVTKTWQDYPFLREKEGDDDETKLELEIRQRFGQLRFWQKLAEADRRSLVGCYGGAILRFADSKPFHEPVDTVPGGLEGLVEIIPAWEAQLEVSEWDTDQTSETYGQPKMFHFNESNVEDQSKQPRQFRLHPDRVVVWSHDGTVHGRSFLEPGYNDLISLEKINGAGGEGFWKNARAPLSLEVDKEASIKDMAKAMGVPTEEVADKMDEQVKDFHSGFDQSLLLQGIVAKPLQITMPSPEHFFAGPLQSFAASINIPAKILVGMQTGERASTEDAREWSQTIMGRRADSVIPNIMTVIDRLEQFGILRESDWHLDWTDLTEPTKAEKVDRVGKMADTNQKMADSGEWIFTPEEMRAAVDYEPLGDADKYRDDLDDDADDLDLDPQRDDKDTK